MSKNVYFIVKKCQKFLRAPKAREKLDFSVWVVLPGLRDRAVSKPESDWSKGNNRENCEKVCNFPLLIVFSFCSLLLDVGMSTDSPLAAMNVSENRGRKAKMARLAKGYSEGFSLFSTWQTFL